MIDREEWDELDFGSIIEHNDIQYIYVDIKINDFGPVWIDVKDYKNDGRLIHGMRYRFINQLENVIKYSSIVVKEKKRKFKKENHD